MEGTHTEPRLIETMRLQDGRIALWPWHRARLVDAARTLGYRLPLADLERRLRQCIQTAGNDRRIRPDRAAAPHRVRLLLAPDGEVSITVALQAPTRSPVRIVLAREPLDASQPLLRYKTTHRPWFDAAARWLGTHPEVFDRVFGNGDGALCEGSRSNVYVRDVAGQWLTPAAACGLLPGVQRQFLLDRGLVREAGLSVADLRAAHALRVSNALRGWLDAQLVADPADPTPCGAPA